MVAFLSAGIVSGANFRREDTLSTSFRSQDPTNERPENNSEPFVAIDVVKTTEDIGCLGKWGPYDRNVGFDKKFESGSLRADGLGRCQYRHYQSATRSSLPTPPSHTKQRNSSRMLRESTTSLPNTTQPGSGATVRVVDFYNASKFLIRDLACGISGMRKQRKGGSNAMPVVHKSIVCVS